MIEENSVNIVVAEDQFFSKNPKTGLTLSRLMGAIIYVCMELEVKLELLSSTNARRILLGNGKGTKSDMANWIRENYIDLGEFIDRGCKAKNSDKYDSLAVLLAFLKKYKLDKKYGTNK